MEGELFSISPEYCVDTNVVSAFLNGSDGEPYPIDQFRPQWRHIDGLFASGLAVMAGATIAELEPVVGRSLELRNFLRTRRRCVRTFATDRQLEVAGAIVNRFDGFARDQNRANDLEVISLAAAEGLCVVTLEKAVPHASLRSPKIPNACEAIGVRCIDVAELLRETRFGVPEEKRL